MQAVDGWAEREEMIQSLGADMVADIGDLRQELEALLGILADLQKETDQLSLAVNLVGGSQTSFQREATQREILDMLYELDQLGDVSSVALSASEEALVRTLQLNTERRYFRERSKPAETPIKHDLESKISSLKSCVSSLKEDDGSFHDLRLALEEERARLVQDLESVRKWIDQERDLCC
ncbi:hypothetical protein HDV05_002945, partial [Chytridiales sp. JEL 0842]